MLHFFVFFSGKIFEILVHLGIMHFLSSIEIHLLKVTELTLSKYERGNGAKRRELFLVTNCL